MTDIIGLDFGTTSSAVAVYRDGRPSVITMSEGALIPSLVSFSRNGEPSAGYRASRQAAVNPGDAVYSAKRLLGRRFDDPVVQLVRRHQPATLRRGADGGVEIVTPSSGRAYSPLELVSLILQHLKRETEAVLGTTVKWAVLAAPVHFTDHQRQAIREAGRLAGLEIVRVINEPTAAALAYGARNDRLQRVMVIDLGSGHCDVSLMEIGGGSVTVFASHGDPALGGEDWDATIADRLADEFLKYNGIDLRRNQHALSRLRSAAEEARQQLSTADCSETTISLPFITSGAAGPRHLEMTLTRAQFAAETAPLNARLSHLIEQVLADAGATGAGVDHVLLIGGNAQMPALQEAVKKAAGPVTVEVLDGAPLVALGAAYQAGQLAGEVEDVALHDVTPLSLGLETMGGLMTPLIPRNTPVPVKRSEIFSTIEDNQTEVEIHVLQGERSMASDNSKLAVFYLRGIPPALRGVPQIEVTFEVDAEGMLHVSARDMASGSSHALTVSNDASLGQSDVQRLVEEAASCEAEDWQKRTLIEAQNLGRQILYQTERCLQHLNGLGEGADCSRKRKEIEAKLQALQQAIDTRNAAEIRRLTGEIQHASTILNHLVYDDPRQSMQKRAGAERAKQMPDRVVEIVVERL